MNKVIEVTIFYSLLVFFLFTPVALYAGQDQAELFKEAAISHARKAEMLDITVIRNRYVNVYFSSLGNKNNPANPPAATCGSPVRYQ